MKHNKIDLREFVTDILDIVGDEFAPKKDGGSPERKKLLGLLRKIVPLQIRKEAELNQTILALLSRIEDEVIGEYDTTNHNVVSPDIAYANTVGNLFRKQQRQSLNKIIEEYQTNKDKENE